MSARRVLRLGRRFFDRPTHRVARDLLGATIAVATPARERRARLVETEAYEGQDPANHAFRGPTPRNRSMFGPPGTLYVYRIHQVVCANLVTRPGQAVLLRAAEPIGFAGRLRGPGRLCRELGITLADDGTDTTRRGSRIRLAGRESRPGPIARGPRIGISRARARPLRFVVVGSAHLSRPAPGVPRLRASEASPSRSRVDGRSRRTRRRRTRPSGGGRSGCRIAGR